LTVVRTRSGIKGGICARDIISETPKCIQKTLYSWVDFTNMFKCSFYAQRSQKCQKTVMSSVYYCALGICAHKIWSWNVGEINPLWRSSASNTQTHPPTHTHQKHCVKKKQMKEQNIVDLLKWNTVVSILKWASNKVY